MINTHNGIKEKGIKPINIEDYPAVKQHLDKYYSQLSKRGDKGDTIYNLRNCAYMEDFSREKIVWGEISDKTKFAIELTGDFVAEATTFLMVGNSLKYLVSFLNSKLSEYIFSKIGTTTGVGTIRWKKFTIEQLYVPKISSDNQKIFENITDEIMENKLNPIVVTRLEKQLNEMIYKVFNLSKEEIEFIEFQ